MKKLLPFLFAPVLGFAQQGNEPHVQEGQFTFDTDKPFKLLTLDEDIKEPVVTKKKKPKRKVFYGIKTKKGFTRKGFGEKMQLELFYVLKKKGERPSTFARDVFWYDYRRAEVRKTPTSGFDPKKGVLLHGPYKKQVGEIIVEEGIFFKGTKHGRWMTYNVQDLVQNKSKYYKGWPKESYVTYYYMLFESGTVAVVGEYKWNEKIGDWIENYPNGKRKRIISYAKEPFDKEFEPYIRKEWDDKGKEIYSK